MSQIKFWLISFIFLSLVACQPKPRNENEIYIGTISGPETDLMQVAKLVAKQKYNLDITLYEFEDYNMPNSALAEGAIDANMFQHNPYLTLTLEQRGYELVPLGNMYLYPMGIYSKKYKTLDELPQHAKIGIPSDPSNEARALKLLETADLIQLAESDDLNLTPNKITSNKKQLKFQELSAAQLPRALDDFDAACINTNFALASGLSPQEALFKEDKESPYTNIVVVRKGEENEEKYKKLMQVLHSEEVQAKAKQLFGEYAVPGWKP